MMRPPGRTHATSYKICIQLWRAYKLVCDLCEIIVTFMPLLCLCWGDNGKSSTKTKEFLNAQSQTDLLKRRTGKKKNEERYNAWWMERRKGKCIMQTNRRKVAQMCTEWSRGRGVTRQCFYAITVCHHRKTKEKKKSPQNADFQQSLPGKTKCKYKTWKDFFQYHSFREKKRACLKRPIIKTKTSTKSIVANLGQQESRMQHHCRLKQPVSFFLVNLSHLWRT